MTSLDAVDKGRPITEDETLEVKFLLEYTVEHFAVLAGLRLIDLVVGAPGASRMRDMMSERTTRRLHNGADTGPDSLGEWPAVNLVHGAVVDIGAVDLGRLRAATEVFLFIGNAGEGREEDRTGTGWGVTHKCLAQAMTPWLCAPRTVCAVPTPDKKGSAPKPSQLRPPAATRPMLVMGPSWTLTPLPRCSAPMAMPRWFMSPASKVAATLIAAGLNRGGE